MSNDNSWWENLWKTLSDWIEDINKFVGPLADLYKKLEEAGIITKEQADKAEEEGWTKEDLINLIRAQMGWQQTLLPWIIVGGVGIGLILVLALRK